MPALQDSEPEDGRHFKILQSALKIYEVSIMRNEKSHMEFQKTFLVDTDFVSLSPPIYEGRECPLVRNLKSTSHRTT